MSTVFLQIGQCGNQVGHAFWKKVLKDEEECKREESLVTGKRGRGTNWALGYHGLKRDGDDHLLEDTLESVRKEVERCDCFNGIILLHSLSGGTGSGFGSRLSEILRETYPMHHLISCVFAPHASGESPLQHYNSLLTLSTLQRCFSLGMEPWEMLRSTCSMPNLKFLQIAQYMNSKMSWSDLLSKLSATLRKYDSSGHSYSSLGTICVVRGDSTNSFQLHTSTLEPKLRQAFNCVKWNPFPVDFWCA